MATNKTVKKHRGTLALLLGVLLMAAGKLSALHVARNQEL